MVIRSHPSPGMCEASMYSSVFNNVRCERSKSLVNESQVTSAEQDYVEMDKETVVGGFNSGGMDERASFYSCLRVFVTVNVR